MRIDRETDRIIRVEVPPPILYICAYDDWSHTQLNCMQKKKKKKKHSQTKNKKNPEKSQHKYKNQVCNWNKIITQIKM